MEGRGPGSDGDRRARAYLAGRMAELGYEPLFDGSWEQPLAIVGVHPDLQRSGAGSALVDWTCELCDADAGSDGVVLDTGNESNLAFYARFGFAEVARVDFYTFRERVLLRPKGAG